MHAYSDPNPQVRREFSAGEAGGAATTFYGKFRTFQKLKLKAVHAIVSTAGTNVGHKLDIYHGTTSIGSLALGTSTANTVFHSATLNEVVDTMEQVSVKTGADIVGKAEVVYEYHMQHDADQTK